MEIMKVDASKFVGNTFPTREGSKLAKALLEQHVVWNDLEVDLTHLPASLLISAFFNSFLQTLFEEDPLLVNEARQVKWHPKFPFQQRNIVSWVERFQPHTGG